MKLPELFLGVVVPMFMLVMDHSTLRPLAFCQVTVLVSTETVMLFLNVSGGCDVTAYIVHIPMLLSADRAPVTALIALEQMFVDWEANVIWHQFAETVGDLWIHAGHSHMRRLQMGTSHPSM